jgi:Holliday junction resolvase RusA-like endonuclease
MRHRRFEIPCYEVWVEARPTFNGRGKEAYYAAVKKAAGEVIHEPILANDVEIETIYSTTQDPGQRMDADNVNKPTLDALKGIAYRDDAQVRDAKVTMFDRASEREVSGRVEHIVRLSQTSQPHVLLIRVYSDTRLMTMGGEAAVQARRAAELSIHPPPASTDLAARAPETPEDEFVPSSGVYRDLSSGNYLCPRCRGEHKRSLLVNGKTGFSCPVCSGFFLDHDRKAKADAPAIIVNRGKYSWMG